MPLPKAETPTTPPERAAVAYYDADKWNRNQVIAERIRARRHAEAVAAWQGGEPDYADIPQANNDDEQMSLF